MEIISTSKSFRFTKHEKKLFPVVDNIFAVFNLLLIKYIIFLSMSAKAYFPFLQTIKTSVIINGMLSIKGLSVNAFLYIFITLLIPE